MFTSRCARRLSCVEHFSWFILVICLSVFCHTCDGQPAFNNFIYYNFLSFFNVWNLVKDSSLIDHLVWAFNVMAEIHVQCFWFVLLFCHESVWMKLEFVSYFSSLFVSFHADLVLKDKIVVYDLAGQRIGWANYDCKFPYQEHFPAVGLIFTVPSIHHLSDWIKRGNLD